MSISKSLSEDITSPIGNSLAIYKEDSTDLLMLKDIYGNIELLNNFYNPSGTYQGSFYDTSTQTSLGSEIKAMRFNSTDISNGVSVVNSSQIKVTNAGVYNLQFSAQIQKTSGGQSQIIYIWFRKNGQDIANSNTAITLANNGHLVVASWNFFSQMNANDYLQIMWYSTDSDIQLVNSNATANYPAIPSVIATMSKV
jgi:hypothetical protein